MDTHHRKSNQIRACVFDVYGTLLDFNSAINKCRHKIGSKSDQLGELWRRKQLEYSWLRTLMGKHADFDQITAAALDYSLATLSIEDKELRSDLLGLFHELEPFPEVLKILKELKSETLSIVILSNGTPHTLRASLRQARINLKFDEIYSIETVGKFKPHPDVYRIPCDGLGLEPKDIAFISANSWDIAGAASFGLKTIWVNRYEAKNELLTFDPNFEIINLTMLPELISTGDFK